MNLEQIDTSTTAGKARVMQLAAEGRKVATRHIYEGCQWSVVEPDDQPLWNWGNNDYAIIAEPVGPEEVWVEVCDRGFAHTVNTDPVSGKGYVAVRYVRAEQ